MEGRWRIWITKQWKNTSSDGNLFESYRLVCRAYGKLKLMPNNTISWVVFRPHETSSAYSIHHSGKNSSQSRSISVSTWLQTEIVVMEIVLIIELGQSVCHGMRFSSRESQKRNDLPFFLHFGTRSQSDLHLDIEYSKDLELIIFGFNPFTYEYFLERNLLLFKTFQLGGICTWCFSILQHGYCLLSTCKRMLTLER